MNLEKTIKSLEQTLYTVRCFNTHEEAADYLDAQIDGKVAGFGDSRTIIDMKLYDKLSKHNTVYDPNQSVDNDGFLEIAKKCLTTDIYLTCNAGNKRIIALHIFASIKCNNCL